MYYRRGLIRLAKLRLIGGAITPLAIHMMRIFFYLRHPGPSWISLLFRDNP